MRNIQMNRNVKNLDSKNPTYLRLLEIEELDEIRKLLKNIERLLKKN